jgi:hypothetical protein
MISPAQAWPALLDVTREPSALPVVTQLRAIADISKRTPSATIRDFAALTVGPGRISFADFVKLRLFDRSFVQDTNPKAFVGQRRNRDLCASINFRHDWLGLMANKIASTNYLAAYGLPTIPIKALYAPQVRTAKADVLCDEDDLAAFLLRADNYPLFGKPVESFQSLGSIGLASVDPGQRALVRFDGSIIPVDRLVAEICEHYAGGYLFQSMLAPHAAIASLIGHRLATVRVVTIVTADGPLVFRACWKIPAGTNVADNYWRPGNLLAQVDRGSGRVLRVTSGNGLSMTEHEVHPQTGAPLIGFAHPEWDAVLALALSGAQLMRHVPLIGWDIACTADGLVIVEMNESPDLFLVQFADRRGALDADFATFHAYQRQRASAFCRAGRTAIAKL